jgi:hypothetical protein
VTATTKTYTVTMYVPHMDPTKRKPTWVTTATSLRDAVAKFRAAKKADPKAFPEAMSTSVRVNGSERSYDVDSFSCFAQ